MVLSHINRDILAIPTSTITYESTFSTGEQVVKSNRCSLATRMVEVVVCTQNWLNSESTKLRVL